MAIKNILKAQRESSSVFKLDEFLESKYKRQGVAGGGQRGAPGTRGLKPVAWASPPHTEAVHVEGLPGEDRAVRIPLFS